MVCCVCSFNASSLEMWYFAEAFSLLHPYLIQFIFMIIFDVFFEIPFQFSQFLCIQHFPCFCHSDLIIHCKSLISGIDLIFNLPLCFHVLNFKVNSGCKAFFVCNIFNLFKSFLPVVTILHLHHRLDFALQQYQ